MDYIKLATALFNDMGSVRRVNSQKSINESLHGEAFVLHYIAKRGGDVQPGEIGSEMNVSTARIATALNSLEKKGLITRQIDTTNRRHILVGITPDGKRTAEEHQKFVLENVAQMLELLGEQDAKEYVRITRKLAELLRNNKVKL
ncbi:MAG: MarR family transcriptional regulator [Oscillospiraceae bacterium]|nr:MarR family transcriptional regulator [Oscillospiraceae bacterium]